MLQPHPRAPQYALLEMEILERDHHPIHGYIAKDKHKQQRWQQHQEDLIIPADILAEAGGQWRSVDLGD